MRLFGYDMRRCLATHDSVSVHVAFSAERSKEVVLKVLHRGRGALSRDESFERLVTEFKLLYDIEDHAVAEIYDFRVTSQYCYIAMEYFPLGHLGTQLDSPLSPAEALHYAREIARGLSIIHTAGVIHRDLKPGNIMLRDDDSVALIDFGISHSAHVGKTQVRRRARRDRRHALLHQPRASRRRSDGRAHGPLRARRHPLSDADGRETLRRRHDRRRSWSSTATPPCPCSAPSSPPISRC